MTATPPTPQHSPQPPRIGSLITLLGNLSPMIEIIDVGAMDIGDSGDPMQNLMREGKFRVVGFEPVKAECDKLNGMGKPGHRYVPHFVGDGTRRTFHLTAWSQTASLYPPNFEFIKRFQTLPQLMEVVSTHEVETRRLDDMDEIKTPDVLKMDVQGAELDCLKGATRILKEHVVFIQTEVEFAPLYKDQPLFADVDAFLRSQGFMLHSFYAPSGRCFFPFMYNNNPGSNGSQALWTDAFYIPDITRWDELSPSRLLKLAIVAHEVTGSFDLAALALQHYDARTKMNLWRRYMGLFMKDPPEAPALP
jgi:FkbM family methyltransferase